MKDKIIDWFANGRVGASSRVMASVISGAKDTDGSHPYDPDDLNRCLLFLDRVPEAREHLHKLCSVSKQWNSLIKRWNEIEKSFLDEVGLNWCNSDSAPKTYDLMKEVLDV